MVEKRKAGWAWTHLVREHFSNDSPGPMINFFRRKLLSRVRLWKNDPYRYAVYNPRGGDARVESGHLEVYYFRRYEAAYAAVNNIYSIDATWVSGMSWKNGTDSKQTYGYSKYNRPHCDPWPPN